MRRQEKQITVAIDLGGTSVRVGVYGASRQLVARHAMPTRVAAGPQSVVDEMAAAVKGLLRDLPAEDQASEVVGVGIGSPGPLNLRTGVLGSLPNFPGWDNFPLRDALAKACGLPVTLESDANAAALAEWKLGAGQETGLASMAMITLGTGVGSGIILDGKVWQGMFGMGGEVGHATVNPAGLACACGSRGCLEMYSSANGLLRTARAIADSADGTASLRSLLDGTELVAPVDIARLAMQGDAAAMQAFESVGHHLGIGIANLINTLDLPMIVVGGGLATSWDFFSDAMFRAILDYSTVYRLVQPTQRLKLEPDHTFIRPAKLGSDAGLIGAAFLPFVG